MSCRIVNCLPSADRKKARDWLLLGEKQIAECEQSGTLCACGESVMDNVQNIRSVIGRPVLSVQTANKLGHINDLVVDPLTGQLAGISIERVAESHALVEWRDIHSIGPDAIMVDRDDSLLAVDQSPIKTLPRAKNDLIGVKVITEHGQLIGTIAGLSLFLADKPLFIYEVRSSIFDRLLGHALYFAASLGCAFSDDGTSLLIRDDTETMDHSLEAAARRLPGPYTAPPYQPAAPRIEVRSHSH